jgi:hypothetical protein
VGGETILIVDPDEDPAHDEIERHLPPPFAPLQPQSSGTIRYSEGKDWQWRAASIHHGSASYGWLVVAVRADLSTEKLADIDALLTIAAHSLALHLELMLGELHLQNLRREREELTDMLLAGDALLGFTHDLNNSLNSIILQTSVLELKAGEALRSETTVIRKLGTQAANKLGMFQRFRDHYRQAKVSVDLNQTIRRLFADGPALGDPVQLELSPEPLTILGHTMVLRQLISVLLRLARSGQPKGGAQLYTFRENDHIWLVLQSISERASAIISREWADFPAAGEESLEMLAAQSRARLIEATLQVSTDSTGRRAVAAIWPAADPVPTPTL